MTPRRDNMAGYILLSGVLSLFLAVEVLVYGPWATNREAKFRIETVEGIEVAAKPYTQSQAHGAWIFAREGCASCHTRVVRTVGGDDKLFGPPTQAGEYAYDNLRMTGQRRMGPDLSRIGGKYTNDELVAFFLNPQANMAKSKMPRYPWLFADIRYDESGTPVSGTPTVELMDLITYLQTMGAGIGDWRNAKAKPKQTGPAMSEAELIAKGKSLYGESDCVACHGAEGKGDGPSAAGYPDTNKPANFTDQKWIFGGDDASVRQTIKAGRPPYMPAHPQYDDDEIAALSAFVRSLSKPK